MNIITQIIYDIVMEVPKPAMHTPKYNIERISVDRYGVHVKFTLNGHFYWQISIFRYSNDQDDIIIAPYYNNETKAHEMDTLLRCTSIHSPSLVDDIKEAMTKFYALCASCV